MQQTQAMIGCSSWKSSISRARADPHHAEWPEDAAEEFNLCRRARRNRQPCRWSSCFCAADPVETRRENCSHVGSTSMVINMRVKICKHEDWKTRRRPYNDGKGDEGKSISRNASHGISGLRRALPRPVHPAAALLQWQLRSSLFDFKSWGG